MLSLPSSLAYAILKSPHCLARGAKGSLGKGGLGLPSTPCTSLRSGARSSFPHAARESSGRPGSASSGVARGEWLPAGRASAPSPAGAAAWHPAAVPGRALAAGLLPAGGVPAGRARGPASPGAPHPPAPRIHWHPASPGTPRSPAPHILRDPAYPRRLPSAFKPPREAARGRGWGDTFPPAPRICQAPRGLVPRCLPATRKCFFHSVMLPPRSPSVRREASVPSRGRAEPAGPFPASLRARGKRRDRQRLLQLRCTHKTFMERRLIFPV